MCIVDCQHFFIVEEIDLINEIRSWRLGEIMRNHDLSATSITGGSVKPYYYFGLSRDDITSILDSPRQARLSLFHAAWHCWYVHLDRLSQCEIRENARAGKLTAKV